MKKAGWLKVGMVVGCCMMIACLSQVARAGAVGPIEEEDIFPDMMKKAPDCGAAYNDFMTVAAPLKACDDLEDVKDDIDAKQQLIKDLQSMKGCKECKKKVAEAQESLSALNEQANVLTPKCPGKKEQYSLVQQLPAKHKQVCKSCSNKWPGKLGPYGVSPCK